jgi:hypothetical protein
MSGEGCLTAMNQSWASIIEDLIDQSKMSVPDIHLERSIDNAGPRSSAAITRHCRSIFERSLDRLKS